MSEQLGDKVRTVRQGAGFAQDDLEAQGGSSARTVEFRASVRPQHDTAQLAHIEPDSFCPAHRGITSR